MNSKQAQLVSLSESFLDFDKIIYILKNFEKVFDKDDFEKRKHLLRTLIKEILITPAKNIKNRVASQIILNFTEANIMEWTKETETEETTKNKTKKKLRVLNSLSPHTLLLV